jgi:hypothetical protein
MARVHVVVARHREPIGWLRHVVDAGVPVTLYDKGAPEAAEADWRHLGAGAQRPNLTILRRPNVGREADTWLAFICEHYDRLRQLDVVVLLQARPWDHVNRATEAGALALLCDPVRLAAHFQHDHVGAAFLTHLWHESHPPPFTERLEISRAATTVLGTAPPTYVFASGAQYVVKPAAILARPLEFWRRLHEMLLNDTINAWEIERLWMYIFGMITP